MRFRPRTCQPSRWLLLCLALAGAEGPAEFVEVARCGSGEDAKACAKRRLPDYDCVDQPDSEGILLAARALRVLLEDLSEQSGGIPRWDAGVAAPVELAPLMESLWVADGQYDYLVAHACPFGYALLEVVRWGACLLASGTDERCNGPRPSLFRVPLFAHPHGLEPRQALPIFLNTRFFSEIWTFHGLLLNTARARGDEHYLEDMVRIQFRFGCSTRQDVSGQLTLEDLFPEPGKVDWDVYVAMVEDPPDTSIGHRAASFNQDVIFDFHANPKERTQECAMGLLFLTFDRLMVMEEMRTEGYQLAAMSVVYVIQELLEQTAEMGLSDLDIFLQSRWPIWDMLEEVWRHATKRRLPYRLDFQPWEILRPAGWAGLTALRGTLPEDHAAVLRSRRTGELSPTYRGLLSALEHCLYAEPLPSYPAYSKLVLFTLIWGARLAKYLPGVLQRARGFGLDSRYIVFCDGESCPFCEAAHRFPVNCVRGEQRALFNKHTMFSAMINSGFDVFYLDFDTVMMHDPLPTILSLAEDHEVVVSRDFGSLCLNTGVIYAKSHRDTAAFFDRILVWLWHNPFEFTQKAFSAFLGNERVVSAGARPPLSDLEKITLEPVPRWTILDPLTQFVTSKVYSSGSVASGSSFEGWTGDIDGIVIYHFLDGGGAVDPKRAVRGQYTNHFDVFYGNEALNLTNVEVPLWLQDPGVEEIMLYSWQDGPPEVTLNCTMLDMNEVPASSHNRRVDDGQS